MSNDYQIFQPYKLRGLTLNNRIVLSPMAMYIADEGYINDFHMTHYGKFAMGGVGLVMVEQTAVCRRGRITNGCLGLWQDDQIEGFKKLADHVHVFGAKIGIQINHGGRKASAQRAWQGNAVLTEEDIASGDIPWQPEGPSSLPFAEGWPMPEEMSVERLQTLRQEFVATALRAVKAGFDLIELHLAHGYLLQSFLSPLANKRSDQYGGSLENRMRLPLEIARDVRAALPHDMPLIARISATDWVEGGWTMEDSLVLAEKLKEAGVDLVDCSSGGNLIRGATNSNLARGPLYQVPFAEEIRQKVNVPTMAVGMIRTAEEAESVLRDGRADLVAIGRQMLFDPFWLLHEMQRLGLDPDFRKWPAPYGWWLEKWAKALTKAA